PNKLLSILGNNGIQLQNIQTEEENYVSQCFGIWVHHLENVKISFIEDSFSDSFKTIPINFVDTSIETEELGGLYHRKLRTITGMTQGDIPENGRQTARDLFDLYVLDQSHKPIPEFIDEINGLGANFPT